MVVTTFGGEASLLKSEGGSSSDASSFYSPIDALKLRPLA